MTRITIDRHKVSLEYETDCLLIRTPEQTPRSIPLQRISQLVCMHSVTLTTQLIGQLHKRGIDLIVLNQRYSTHSFALYADQQAQVERRCRQYKWQQHTSGRLTLSIELCRHKFKVLERLLRKFQKAKPMRERITASLASLAHCPSEQSLRGTEGIVQRMAFEHWRSLLPGELNFRTRQRRPPPDPVNAALSLACDLMEPVRPHVEHWVVSLFNDGIISKRHFTQSEAGCLLGKKGREAFYEHYSENLDRSRRQLDSTSRWLTLSLDAGQDNLLE